MSTTLDTMDSPLSAVDNDEVVADSEDEGEMGEMLMDMAFGHKTTISSISAFTTPAHGEQRNQLSSISGFPSTAGPSRIRNDIGFGQIGSPILDDSFSSLGTASIADRAKTRQRTQSSRPIADEVIELSDDEDELYLHPTKKARIPPKPKPKKKSSPSPTETRLANLIDKATAVQAPAIAPAKPERPRPKPRLKRPPQPSSDPLPPHDYPFSANPPPRHLPSSGSRGSEALPSPLRQVLLPPSKEAQPSAVIPPIAVLEPQLPESDVRFSSPSSLFDESPATKKRKRQNKGKAPAALNVDQEMDELVSSPNPPPAIGQPRSHVPAPTKDNPPPTAFFAATNSSAGDRSDLTSEREVVDLSDLPSTFVPTKATVKPRKKKTPANSNALDFDPPPGGLNVLDEDEGDGDFDPSGGSGKKGKEKAKRKPKGPTQMKEKKSAARKEKVEVLITTKRPVKETKGKDKAPGDKEVFKSREFIEDSDDGETPSGAASSDPLLLSGGSKGNEPVPRSPLPASSLKSVESVSKSITSKKAHLETSTPGSGSGSGAKATPTSFEKEKANTSHSSSPSDPNIAKETKRPKGKKRKSIVESDEDEPEEWDKMSQNDDAEGIVPKKQKKSKRKAGVVLSEEEEVAPKIDLSKKQKGKEKKKVGKKQKNESPVKEKEMENAVGDQEREKTPEAPISPAGGHDKSLDEVDTSFDGEEDTSKRAVKENIVPKPAVVSRPSVVGTPQPYSRAGSLNPGNSTPLYTRYEVAPRRSSLPMSELIRRASSKPGSPFPAMVSSTPVQKGKAKASADNAPTETPSPSVSTYSPYMKSSRRLLSRIMPLHPNRKTPPPPPPPPPPKKKTKKELEMEEKWEEELVDSVGGIEAWASMGDAERKEMRRAKRDMEMNGWDD